jgi:hypothetical protein
MIMNSHNSANGLNVERRGFLALRAPPTFLLRALLFAIWIALLSVTPILTTCLMVVTLLGLAIVLFFDGLLQLPTFHAGPVLAISAISLGFAALLNCAVAVLRPR